MNAKAWWIPKGDETRQSILPSDRTPTAPPLNRQPEVQAVLPTPERMTVPEPNLDQPSPSGLYDNPKTLEVLRPSQLKPSTPITGVSILY